MVLFSVSEQMQALNERAHMLAFDIIFVQIKKQFANLPNMEVSGQSINYTEFWINFRFVNIVSGLYQRLLGANLP